MQINKIKFISMIILPIFLIIGCKDSTGTTTPENASISGTITFTGDLPADGAVAVSLSSNWPPQGAPAASSEITSTNLSSGAYAYTFVNVTFGSYASISVSWQDPKDDDPTTNQQTLGAYGVGTENWIGAYPFFEAYGGTDPTTVTVSESDYSKTGLDFSANLIYAASSTEGQ